ncbi:hypothetical protein NJC40_03530 [Pseudomonas sp. 21LCFQ02]|uniref:hypothetical protein n=1 Tax=Pseudomonas sp. 21LCFQ02 TaxID=2957505 RepID=UPI00209AF87A|nr:hypothetical protein [Pseudomonas sp. 21LCFQ02]MCO8166849.1 hypothetical protein [Pseudomonas sp. 21LCFQ02]
MSSLQLVSTVSIGIITAWALWSMLSFRVNDGIVGKVIYFTIAVAGYAMATRGEWPYVTPTVAGVTFHVALACAGVRHWFVRTYWMQVKTWLCRHLHCEHCLTDPRFGSDPGKTDRRRS